MSQVVLEESNSQVVGWVEQAIAGEEVIILRDSKPVAKLVPVPKEEPKSGYGNAKDVILYMADDFDAPLEDFKDYM